MATLFTFVIVILVMIIIALCISLIMLFLKEKEKPQDEAILLNLMPYRTSGHAIGSISKYDRGAEGRWKINFDPKDVRPKDILEKNWKNEQILVDTNKLLVLPKGYPSAHKSMMIALPPFPEDIPEQFRNTEFGKILQIWTEKKNVEKTIIDSIREGSIRKDEFLKELGDGEISATYISKISGLLINDIKENVSRSNKTSTTSPTISKPIGGV